MATSMSEGSPDRADYASALEAALGFLSPGSEDETAPGSATETHLLCFILGILSGDCTPGFAFLCLYTSRGTPACRASGS